MEVIGAGIFLTTSAFRPSAAGRDARSLFATGVLQRRPPPPLSMSAAALDKGSEASGNSASKRGGGGKLPTSNYVVPLDLAPTFARPLKEILRDLNKRAPDNIINAAEKSIPWYHANRMLSFYAPGWCGEVRNVIFPDNSNVTVVYRLTIRGLDGEVHRESTATVSLNDGRYKDPVAAAEELAFCKACARFGFGLYLYHEEVTL